MEAKVKCRKDLLSYPRYFQDVPPSVLERNGEKGVVNTVQPL